jgi:ABC-type phosphate transport system substrate-binding protein
MSYVRHFVSTLLVLTIWWGVGSTFLHGQIAVIANPSVPQDTVNKPTLLDYYTGDLRAWSDNQPVVVLDLDSDRRVRSSFYEDLGKSASRMRSIWMRRKLSGEGDPPEAIASNEDMITRVAETPGAIGFVPVAYVDERVKVLLTMGNTR